mgnify:CR=1 FL=1
MNILTSLGRKHLNGHKGLTADRPTVHYDPDFVYIPATDNKGVDLKDALTAGSKVKCQTVLGVRADFNIPVFSSVSGEIVEIKKIYNKSLLRAANYFVIKNDKKYTEETSKPTSENLTKEELVEFLRSNGFTGLGGAAFPTYIKYKTDAKIDHILINDVECEPYLTTDYTSTGEYIDDVVLAATRLASAMGVKDVVIAIKKNKLKAIEHIKKALEGNSLIRLVLVKDVYPAGYERTLIKMVFKKEYNVLPSEVGVIVNNFQTMASIGKALKGEGRLSRRYFTFSGEALNSPANVYAPYGTMINEIIEAIGGVNTSKYSIVAGGPMMGRPLRQIDIPLAEADSGVTVLRLSQLEVGKDVPCLRCGECVDHCPMYLQPVLMYQALNRNDYERANKLGILSCVECGLCSAVCPSHIELTNKFASAKPIVKIKTMKK